MTFWHKLCLTYKHEHMPEMPFNSFWGMNMNTSGSGIAQAHETDALDLSTMTKHEMPYGIDAIAEIRMSTPADYPAIIRMGEAADMGTLDGFEDTLVATHPSGGIAAFCRLRIYDGIAHVNPIVVDESLRGHGVGAALMKAARERYGELRFVARGYAVGFYKFIGCTPVEWGEIAPEVASDCDDCEKRDECQPLPMKYPIENEECAIAARLD